MINDGKDSKRTPITLRLDAEVWERVGFIAEAYRWSKNTAAEEMLKKAAGMRNLIEINRTGDANVGGY